MTNSYGLTRRACISLFACQTFAGSVRWPEALRRRLVAWLEKHRRLEGGYGWGSDLVAHVTPTFGVVGSYRLLGTPVPDAARVASFVRDKYPVPELRRKDRPLWRLDFKQVQTLLWLEHPIDSFRPLASTWKQPTEFTRRYEFGGNPVLQHQAMAMRVRGLLKLSPSPEDKSWREYFLARRRANSTSNTTPASDGSGGHVMNTPITNWKTEYASGTPELREFVNKRGSAMEVGRCWPPVDGVAVEPKLREAKNDRYYIRAFAASPGPHKAEAEIRVLETGKISTISTAWQSSE